jgi:hypothetical protein
MTYFLLSDAELDAVAGAGDYSRYITIYQNSRGGDAVAVGGYNGFAIAGTGAASAGNITVSAVGGAGGTNTITIAGPL